MDKIKKRLMGVVTGIVMATMLQTPCLAASDNSLIYSTVKVAKDTVFTDVTTAPAIGIIFKDAVSEGTGYKREIFYIRVTNAKFTEQITETATLAAIGAERIEKQSDTVIKVVIQPVDRKKQYVIPLLVKLSDGEANVFLEAMGSETTITTTGENEEKKTVGTISAGQEEKKEEKQQENLEAAAQNEKKVSFKVGEKSFNINEKQKTMEGQTYLSNEGRVMIPLRYVAEILDIKEKDIAYAEGKVTIKTAEGEMIFTVGDKKVNVGEQAYTMQTAAVNKNGRVYVPAGELGRILKVEVQWDKQNKIATFIKK